MDLQTIGVSNLHHDASLLVLLNLLLPVLPSLDPLPTPRHTLHPDGFPIDLNWHLPHLPSILNKYMFYIISYLLCTIILLRSSKLSLTSLLSWSTLHRS